jgi:hypothetical protein
VSSDGWSLLPYFQGSQPSPNTGRLSYLTNLNENFHRHHLHPADWIHAFVSGCASSRDSQQTAVPTVSGYIDMGVHKNF